MPAIIKGNQHFQAITYVGNGGIQTIEVGFKVGLLWIKSRSAATDNKVVDIVRGATKALITNSTGAETTDTNGITAFTNTGFTLGSDSVYNTAGATYVAWCWAAGDTTVSNTVGTIESQVNVNPTSGFSIVTYTGTGANATVGHGLGVAPSFIIFKRRDSTSNWPSYHQSLGNTGGVYLNGTNAFTTGVAFWNNTSPTSTVFTIGGANEVNVSTATNVAYCFAQIAGYSAFGSYTGNGSADGPFVYLGFRPEFLMLKSATNGSYGWTLWDTSRNTYNPMNKYLQANGGNAEETFLVPDFLSNGFKIRSSDVSINQSGGTMIYAAFAENPFAYSNAR